MFFLLETAHGTVLHVAENLLRHARAEDAVDLVFGWIDPLRPDLVHLMTGSGSAFWIMGDSDEHSIFSYRVGQTQSAEVNLIHPLNGHFASAGIDEPIYVNRLEAHGWEHFRLVPSTIVPHAVPVALMECAGMPPARALSSLAQSDQLERLTDIAWSILRSVHIAELVPTIGLIRDLPTYSEIFPVLQMLLRSAYPGGARAFWPQYAWGGGDFVKVGRCTYGQPRILPYPPATVTLGAFCSIAEGVTMILGNHLTRSATTFPFQAEAVCWPSRFAQMNQIHDDIPTDIVIGNDVWIGRGATILPGTVIGDGCIIAAEAIVRGTVPAYSLYGGNPGRIIRMRFDSETIARLTRLKWWEWPDWKIDRHSERLLGDIQIFLDCAEADGTVEAMHPPQAQMLTG